MILHRGPLVFIKKRELNALPSTQMILLITSHFLSYYSILKQNFFCHIYLWLETTYIVLLDRDRRGRNVQLL